MCLDGNASRVRKRSRCRYLSVESVLLRERHTTNPFVSIECIGFQREQYPLVLAVQIIRCHQSCIQCDELRSLHTGWHLPRDRSRLGKIAQSERQLRAKLDVPDFGGLQFQRAIQRCSRLGIVTGNELSDAELLKRVVRQRLESSRLLVMRDRLIPLPQTFLCVAQTSQYLRVSRLACERTLELNERARRIVSHQCEIQCPRGTGL